MRPWKLFPLLLLLACSTEDKRLPQKLMEEARALSSAGKTMEAKCMLERIVAKYPDTPEGRRANQDLFIIQSVLKQEIKEKQRLTRGAMERVMYALKRYKNKEGEYPWNLQQLLPNYLDIVPESPWGHPFFYHPFVTMPIEEVKDKKGRMSQKFNVKADGYHLACLGTDLQPGGTDLARDYLVANGTFIEGTELPKIPQPQPTPQ